MATDVQLLSFKDALKALDLSTGYWYFLVRSKDDATFFTRLRDFHFSAGSGHEREYELFHTAAFTIIRIRKSKVNRDAIVEVLLNDGLAVQGYGTNYDRALGYSDTEAKIGG